MEKTIGLDLDDTITILDKYMKLEAERYDKDKNGNGIVNKNTYLLGDQYNWNDEEKDYFFKYYRPNAIKMAEIRPNAKLVLKNLKDLGFKIVIITSRSPKYYNNPYEETKKFLDDNEICYTKLIVNAKTKLDACINENVSYFIDDMPKNCLEVAENNNIKVFIFDNFNNKLDDDRITRIYDFNELYNYIINDNRDL